MTCRHIAPDQFHYFPPDTLQREGISREAVEDGVKMIGVELFGQMNPDSVFSGAMARGTSDDRLICLLIRSTHTNPVKLAGGGIMVGGCFSRANVGDLVLVEGSMDQVKYMGCERPQTSLKITKNTEKKMQNQSKNANFGLKILKNA